MKAASSSVRACIRVSGTYFPPKRPKRPKESGRRAGPALAPVGAEFIVNGSRVRVQETGARRRGLTVERLAGGFRRRSCDGREKEGFPQAEARVEMAAIGVVLSGLFTNCDAGLVW